MAKMLHITLKDINGLLGGTHFWCNNEVEAFLALQNVANLSNAQIVSAYMTEALDITTLAANTAVAANIETARAKVKVKFRGADSGSVANPFSYTTIEVPAPLGSLVNAATGDITNALYDPFKTKVHSTSGVTMTEVVKVFYARSR